MQLKSTFIPEIATFEPTEYNDLLWTGPLDHIGPTHSYTPLEEALENKTNCACYMIMIGMTGLVQHLVQDKINEKFAAQIKQFIYLYQFDWRYPVPWNTNPDFLSDDEKWESIKFSMPYYFLRVMLRLKKPFHGNTVTQDASFMIKFALHIGGASREEIIKDWVSVLIKRLNEAAARELHIGLYYPDFDSPEDYIKAVVHNHGSPLSPRILDPGVALEDIHHKEEALAILNAIDFSDNPIIQPATAFEESFGVRGPYFTSDRDW